MNVNPIRRLAMHEKLTKPAFLNICRQMGVDPNEMVKVDEFKAFADTTVDDAAAKADAFLSELPPVATPAAVVEEVKVEAKTGIDALMEQLDAIIKNKEAKKEDIKTAEELKARLEELKAAQKNAEDFLAKQKPVVEEVKAEGAAAPAVGGGAGTLEAELTTPSATV